MKTKYVFISIIFFTYIFSQCDNPDQTEYYIECSGGVFEDQVIWSLSPGNINGGAPYSETVCLSDGPYNLMMSDLGNNGWNGNTWKIYEYSSPSIIAECTLDSGNFDTCSFFLGEVENCGDYLGQSACDNDLVCEWIEDVEITSCGSISSQTECNMTAGCYWDCNDWGDWYTWICYGSYTCLGGTFENDNSYCEEINFPIGDINLDFFVNIQDVLVLINLILNNESTYNADVNGDGGLNVLDIIDLVHIILNN